MDRATCIAAHYSHFVLPCRLTLCSRRWITQFPLRHKYDSVWKSSFRQQLARLRLMLPSVNLQGGGTLSTSHSPEAELPNIHG